MAIDPLRNIVLDAANAFYAIKNSSHTFGGIPDQALGINRDQERLKVGDMVTITTTGNTPIPASNPFTDYLRVKALKLELEIEKRKRLLLEEELAKLKQQPKPVEAESLTERINNLKKKG